MKKLSITGLLIVSLFVVYTGCRKDNSPGNTGYSSAPLLPEQTYDYTFSTNDDLATLGRVLFYDKKLSVNNTVSCGSCHKQSNAFADGKQFSTGVQDIPTRRNSPPIIKFYGSFFWDGRADSFDQLVLMPLMDHVEMKNYDIEMLEQKIRNVQYYPGLFEKAYGSGEINIDKVQTAIAEFLQNFRFDNNKFNDLLIGGAELTSMEAQGENLFWNKAKCGSCHNGNSFNGWSVGECIGLDVNYADNGIGEITNTPAYNGVFRVPPLLNIEFTAPYMHDGRFQTLEQVIEHYNSGVKNHPNLSSLLMENGQPQKLNLTDTEKESLIAFLKTLSDPSVFSDVRFSDPFKN